jgi:hypothetical protein
VFLPLLFPDGRSPSRRWRPIAWLGVLSIGLNFVSAVDFLWRQRGPALVGPEGPAEEGTSHAMFVVVEFAAFPMMLVAGLGAVVSLVVRFRRSRRAARKQIKWFAFASVLTFASCSCGTRCSTPMAPCSKLPSPCLLISAQASKPQILAA